MRVILTIFVIMTMLVTGLILRTAAESDNPPEPVLPNDTSGAGTAIEPPYEMIMYYVTILKIGPNYTAEMTPEVTALIQAHLENIKAMHESGELVLAGPFADETGKSDLVGLFFFRVESMERAKELTDTDPGVKAGRYTYEILPWMGPKTLSF